MSDTTSHSGVIVACPDDDLSGLAASGKIAGMVWQIDTDDAYSQIEGYISMTRELSPPQIMITFDDSSPRSVFEIPWCRTAALLVFRLMGMEAWDLLPDRLSADMLSRHHFLALATDPASAMMRGVSVLPRRSVEPIIRTLGTVRLDLLRIRLRQQGAALNTQEKP